MKHRYYSSATDGSTVCSDFPRDDCASRYELRGSLDALIRDLPINWLLANDFALVWYAALHDPTSILT